MRFLENTTSESSRFDGAHDDATALSDTSEAPDLNSDQDDMVNNAEDAFLEENIGGKESLYARVRRSRSLKNQLFVAEVVERCVCVCVCVCVYASD